MLHYLMGDLFPKMDVCYFAILDSYVLFGKQASALRAFIDEYDVNRLSSVSPIRSQIPSEVSAYGNIFLMVRPALAASQIKDDVKPELQTSLELNREVIGKIASVSFCMKNLKDRQTTKAAMIAVP
jgi:hypothetical protein